MYSVVAGLGWQTMYSKDSHLGHKAPLYFGFDLGILPGPYQNCSPRPLFSTPAPFFCPLQARDVAFNGRMVACSVIDRESVALYHLLNLPKRQQSMKVDPAAAISRNPSPPRAPAASGSVLGSPSALSPTKRGPASSTSPQRARSPARRTKERSPTSPIMAAARRSPSPTSRGRRPAVPSAISQGGTLTRPAGQQGGGALSPTSPVKRPMR